MIKRLANGNLLIPLRAEAEDGTLGDGVIEVTKDDPDYEKWLPFVEEAT